MYGAILGDMIGAPYEFDRGGKTKDFPLFGRKTHFTDDSVMTIAVAEALMSLDENADDEAVHRAVARAMRSWAGRYPNAGYGGTFRNGFFHRARRSLTEAGAMVPPCGCLRWAGFMTRLKRPEDTRS